MDHCTTGERDPTTTTTTTTTTTKRMVAERRTEDVVISREFVSPAPPPAPPTRSFLLFSTSPLRTARSVPRTQMRARKSTNKMDRTCAGELSPVTSVFLFLPFPFTAFRVVPPSPCSSSSDVYRHSHASSARPLPLYPSSFPFLPFFAVTFRFTFAAIRS